MLYGLIHASGVATFGYALYYDLLYVHLPANLAGNANFAAMTAFPGKWKFLTVWNIVLQLVYHTVGLANDVVGSNELNVKRQTTLQKFRDGFFASWAFPTGIFVSVSFWTLYSIDRALVFPKELDSFYPNWLNHAVHTGPILFLTAEFYSVPKIFPSRSLAIVANLCFSTSYIACYPSSLVGASILTGGIAWYLSWITWVNHYSGVWAYPVLEILSNTQRALFMGSSGLIILGFYFFGEALNKWRWGGKGDSRSGSLKGGKASSKGKKKSK